MELADVEATAQVAPPLLKNSILLLLLLLSYQSNLETKNGGGDLLLLLIFSQTCRHLHDVASEEMVKDPSGLQVYVGL